MTDLEDYLRYYRDLKAPGYAVLVTGSWGVGKTHQVRAALGEDGHYYVSLFGVSTVDDAHAAFLAALSPNLNLLNEAGDGAQVAGGSIAALGRFGSAVARRAILRKAIPNRVMLFDDLERCDLNVKEYLGVIATCLERYDFPVVVLCHDDRLGDEFTSYREKIFGQTLHAHPQVDQAFDAFLADHDEAARVLLERYRELILDIFARSQVGSLRILRHVMQDTARLIGCLDEDLMSADRPVEAMLARHIALACEYRGGRLKAKEVGAFGSALLASCMRMGKPDDMPVLREIETRYRDTAIPTFIVNTFQTTSPAA